MSLDTVLTSLYAGSGIAAALLYLPQIRTLATRAEARRAMSLVSWGGWWATSWVSMFYLLLVVHDQAMILVCAVNTLCQGLVFALAVAQRIADRGCRLPLSATTVWQRSAARVGNTIYGFVLPHGRRPCRRPKRTVLPVPRCIP